MSIHTRIEINPNLRVDRDYTIVDLDEDVYGEVPAVLETVEVFESSSGLQGRGWVTAVDPNARTVTLLVDWANLDLPRMGTWAEARVHQQSNMVLGPAPWRWARSFESPYHPAPRESLDQ